MPEGRPEQVRAEGFAARTFNAAYCNNPNNLEPGHRHKTRKR